MNTLVGILIGVGFGVLFAWSKFSSKQWLVGGLLMVLAIAHGMAIGYGVYK